MIFSITRDKQARTTTLRCFGITLLKRVWVINEARDYLFGCILLHKRTQEAYANDISMSGGGGGNKHIIRKNGLYFYPTRYTSILGFRFPRRYRAASYILDGSSEMPQAIGSYITHSPNIISEIETLLKGLDEESRRYALDFISRVKSAYISPNHIFTALSTEETNTIKELESHFYARIIPLSPFVFYYEGYLLPRNHFEISVFYYKHNMGLFSLDTLATIRTKDIIDAGGFIGDSAIIFEREFTTMKIHSFEATKENFDDMLQTIKLNHSTRIVPINKGLGEKEEWLDIAYNSSGSTLVNATQNDLPTQKAHIITLDSYVKENDVKVGFIKVDIEGFEQPFLRGALETIKSQKPAMLISIYHNASDFFNIKPFLESLNLGYRFKIARPIDGGLFAETALYCEV